MSRNGKAARLPATVRVEVNERLREGEPGNDLGAWLKQEQSCWALPRWRPLMRMVGGGDLGKFFADAILRLQPGAAPPEVPERRNQELEAFRETIARGCPLSQWKRIKRQIALNPT